MSILNTDLVFGNDPSHLVHYMNQCAMAGKIQASFLSEDAKFKPVHNADLTKAIAQSIDSSLTGQFALRGAETVSSRALLNLVEQSCGFDEGRTKKLETLLPVGRMLEEYLVGMGADTNMAEMIAYFAENQSVAPVSGNDFWTATGTSADESLSAFYSSHRVEEDDERLLTPTFGGYKFNMAD